jgi:hypothetical protein
MLATQRLYQCERGIDLQCCHTLFETAQGNPDFMNCLLLSDVANAFLERFVNKQNCGCAAPEIPPAFHERPVYSEKVVVWCAVVTTGVS